MQKSHLTKFNIFSWQIFQKTGVENNFINIVKGTYEKSTASIILNSERLKSFSLNSETNKQKRIHTFTTAILHKTKVLDTNWTRKIRGIQIGKEEVKLCLDDMGLYIDSAKESTKKTSYS